jgi:hypothetical protein
MLGGIGQRLAIVSSTFLLAVCVGVVCTQSEVVGDLPAPGDFGTFDSYAINYSSCETETSHDQ